MTQLTLQLDDELILRAKAYSAQVGQSLSHLVSGYFTRMTRGLAPVADRSEEMTAAVAPETLADQQYRLASHYPGEYVVLVGDRVIHHSTCRAEAGQAFHQVFREDPLASPVMVDPKRPRRQRPRPIVRGRALSRHRRT